MRSLSSYISEGEIGNLKGIRFIRHYTTLKGLLSILKDGKIKANESEGDIQWSNLAYDLGSKQVVSFLDSRYDDEKEYLVVANDNDTTMSDTWALGLHIDEVCAYIEYNFDKIPQDILNKATFIKFLEEAVPGYTEAWNEMIETIDEFDLKKNIKTSEDFADFINNDIFNRGVAYNWHHAYQYDKKDIKAIMSVIKRRNLKAYSDYDTKALLNACILDNKQEILSILKSHGWKKGDEENFYILEMLPKIEYEIGTLDESNFLDYINVKYFRTIKKYIVPGEIRIACDIPLKIPGCTIHIFNNVAKAVAKNMNDEGLYDLLMKELSKHNNIKIH